MTKKTKQQQKKQTTTTVAPKRKQTSNETNQPPAKKVKTDTTTKAVTVVEKTNDKKKQLTRSDIKKIEAQIIESKQNINQLADLLQFCEDIEEITLIAASLGALCRVFTHLWKQKDLNVLVSDDNLQKRYLQTEESNDKALNTYRKWVSKKYESFKDLLFDYLVCEEPAVQVSIKYNVFSFILTVCHKIEINIGYNHGNE
jgi:cystathionine beta-lyase/cystathionine gamma-synthase